MNAKVEQIPATNVNPMLNVSKDGTIIYSNEASESMLNEWGVRVGEKLPPNILDLVHNALSRNNPEKTEVKVENKVYLLVFSPLLKHECVSISGFDMTDFDFWPKESAELFRTNDPLVLNSGQTHQFMEDSTDPNGTRYCWLNYKFPFTDSKNKKYVGGIGIDATDRVRAEETLQESEERFRMLFTNMTEGFVLVEVIYNEDGTPCDYRYLEMNPVYEFSTGIKKEEALGKRIKEAFPNTNPMVIEKLIEVELSGQPSKFEMFSQVVNRYFDIHMFIPQKGKIAGIFEDITERKVAEDALKKANCTFEEKIKERTAELEKAYESLKESKKSLAEAQEMAHVGNWVWDIDTDKAYWSEEMYRIFKRDPQKLAPSLNEYYGYIHPDDLDYYCKVTDNTRKVSTSGFDFRIVLANGEERTLHMKSEFIYNNENIPIRTKGIVQDITERKKVEDALVKTEIIRKKEIHHRIKNNLQVISSLLDLQTEKFKGKKIIEESQVLAAFKESQDRVISMALIHEELHKGGHSDTLNISQYIEDLANNLLLTYRLGNSGIILDTDIEENIFFNMDTSVPLGIIINELVSNSLKHAFIDRDKGEIRIKLYRKEYRECRIEGKKNTTFILSVSDNGIGIPEDLEIEDLDSLGLHLVTTLVEQLDGELDLNRDNGTEFTIMFVIAENIRASVKTSLQLVDNE